MAIVTMYDPPRGWMYGFPRAIPKEVEANAATNPTVMHDWIVECGYPQALIESFGDYFYCRYWEEDDEHPGRVRYT